MPASQYDAFAADYEWLFSDAVLAAGERPSGLEASLAGLPPGAAVLDCACGTGITASSLALDGWRVTGTDASERMVDQARRRAAAVGSDVRHQVCTWESLPNAFGTEFDLVLCCGNSIGHCPDEAAMLRALRGMHAVTKPGGRLLLHSRNWERVLSDRVRFTHFPPRHRDDTSCLPIYVWTVPETLGARLTAEVLLVFQRAGRTTLRHHAISYWPFGAGELLARLRQCGFRVIDTDFTPDCEAYTVTSSRP